MLAIPEQFHHQPRQEAMLEIPRSESKTQNGVNALFYPAQTAIASVLEQRRNKFRALKQGIMQKLLTGRMRLA